MTDQPYPNRGLVTAAVMLAALMNTLDSTIANVALPHIQGSLSASPDEIGWVLTSYIVAGAMMTPVSGWITTVIGAKKTLLLSVAGFTLASMLCGVASSLPELVLARIAQGAFGAFAIPLSQSVLLNINPPERHAQAMALWATGTVLGPIFGPVVGGYLTEQASWRWCFYINVPLGILTLALAWLFMSSDGRAQPRRFDGLGFSALIIAVACVQLVVDRGPGQDWYSSAEIWTETIIGLAAVWVFIVHTLTTEHPFIDRSLMRDSNLVGATLFGFFAGTLMFGSMAILPIMMQSLMGYPVMTAGIISMPRGLGTLASLVLLPHLAARLGMRAMLLLGLLTTGCAYWQMMHFDLSMGPQPLIVSGIVQGLGQALFFVPLTTLGFATVDPRMRAEASAMFNLVRMLGMSIGISLMQALAVRNSQLAHASMAGQVTPSDAVVHATASHLFRGDGAALAAFDAEISRQASMIGFLDDFRVLFVLTVACVPMAFLLRSQKRAKVDLAHIGAD